MRLVRFILAPVMLVAALTVHDEQPAASAMRPAGPLLGRWEIVSIGGKVLPGDVPAFWTIDATHVTVTDGQGREISRIPCIIDASKEPPRLVMKVEGEKDRVGRYRFKGEDLELLITLGTGEPPTSWNDGSIMVRRRAAKR